MKNPFVYQRPDVQQVNYIEAVRMACQGLAALLESTPMDPRCKALAKTKLEETSMWANKGIVFVEAPADPPAEA